MHAARVYTILLLNSGSSSVGSSTAVSSGGGSTPEYTSRSNSVSVSRDAQAQPSLTTAATEPALTLAGLQHSFDLRELPARVAKLQV